jgi:beta-glucanase (GH16 family)
MPTGNLPGWKQVFADDFTSSTDKCWGDYSANPIPSSPTAAWVPGRVSISGGEAVLNSSYDSALGKWASGGMSSAPCLGQEYGKYEVRFRMDQAQGVKYAILLWPTSGIWPQDGEIDFGEDGGGNRSETTLTNHYADSSGGDEIDPQVHTSADFSQWQTLGVEWTPNKLVETLNGQDVGEIDGSHVPADPMNLDIQTESNTDCSIASYYSCMDSTTPANVNMDVDWVVSYAPQS